MLLSILGFVVFFIAANFGINYLGSIFLNAKAPSAMASAEEDEWVSNDATDPMKWYLPLNMYHE